MRKKRIINGSLDWIELTWLKMGVTSEQKSGCRTRKKLCYLFDFGIFTPLIFCTINRMYEISKSQIDVVVGWQCHRKLFQWFGIKTWKLNISKRKLLWKLNSLEQTIITVDLSELFQLLKEPWITFCILKKNTTFQSKNSRQLYCYSNCWLYRKENQQLSTLLSTFVCV